MTALILLSSLTVGGTEKKSVRLANELAARGRSIRLAYLNGPDTLLPEVSDRVPVTCFHRKGKFSPATLRHLGDFVEEKQVSVVLCMNLYPLLYAGLLKPVLGHKDLKVVVATNTTYFKRRRDHWFIRVYAPLIRRTDTVIYGCGFQRDLWEQMYRLGTTEPRVIYNGVDTTLFDPATVGTDLRRELGIERSIVIGCVGRLDPEKNQAILLDAVAGLSGNDTRFDIMLVGDGPERSQLESRAAALGIRERVHFLGRLTDVRPALAAMDVFVLPSIAVETFSNAALEAMAMSVPVILSDIAGAAEMVSDGDNGFLYQCGDQSRLSGLLLELAANTTLRQRLARNARDTVLDKFHSRQMVDAYDSLLFGAKA